MFGNIFIYIELAVTLLALIPNLITLFTLKQKITGTQLQQDISPVLLLIQSVVPSFTLDPVIVLDFCNAFADIFNKYVVNSSTQNIHIIVPPIT